LLWKTEPGADAAGFRLRLLKTVFRHWVTLRDWCETASAGRLLVSLAAWAKQRQRNACRRAWG
jgi:hypothetical protein